MPRTLLAATVIACAAAALVLASTSRQARGPGAVAPSDAGTGRDSRVELSAQALDPPESVAPASRAAVPITPASLAPVQVVHADDGTALAGVEVIEVAYGTDAMLRHVSDGDGCVWLPPARRGSTLIGVRDGFCLTSIERRADSPTRLVLRLQPSRRLAVRVVDLPSGLGGKYDLCVDYAPRYLDPQTQLVFAARPRPAVGVAGAFMIERVDTGASRVSLRVVDRRGGGSLTLGAREVPGTEDEVVFALGGGVFADPFADVTVRVDFRTPEPSGAFSVWLAPEAGGSSDASLRGERRPGESVVVLRRLGVRVGPYRARVTTAGGLYKSEVVEVVGEAHIDVVIEQWDSVVVRLRGVPAEIAPRSFAVVGQGPDGDARASVAFDVEPPAVATVRNLRPGRHTFAVRGPGFGTEPVAVDVVGRETTFLDLTVVRLHLVRVGVFLATPEPGEVRFERDGEVVHRAGVAVGRRWVDAWLPAGQYLVTATFPSLREHRRLDVFGDFAELRFGKR